MSTVNERLRQQEMALLVWLTACVKQLGGEITLEKSALDSILMDRGLRLSVGENETALTLTLKRDSNVVNIDGKPFAVEAKPETPSSEAPKDVGNG